MIRLLLNLLISLVACAIGIVVAGWLLDDMTVSTGGFVTAVVVFAIAQMILSPFILKVAATNAQAFVGGVGIVSTLVALFIATLVGDGISIDGVSTWILAALIVWLVTAVASLLVPFILIKMGVKALQNQK
ncbi:hypothetical protein FE697_014510 [Mumia zhuanghuii]|uniref:Phage holin family protein n=2 Tax=Mumia TaxID=1546255 RepID=A0ABW1QPF8_9ACTN|nr:MULTISPECIES: phage holin family protein [Mumia]KAA1422363.1 hypothetical protein FE697_014510 [Mumia zhuanghuii]